MLASFSVVEKPLSMMEASLELTHRDCLVQGLSKGLGQTLNLWMPNDSLQEGNISAYFGIRENLDEKEFKELLTNYEQFVNSAVMYKSPADQRYTTFKISYRDQPVSDILMIKGLAINSYEAFANKELLSVQLLSTEPLKDITSFISRPDVTLRSIKRKTLEESGPRKILNDNETKILALLKDRGFFSLPTREVTLKQLSQELGISDSKLSMDVRRISGKIFTEYLNEIVKGATF